MNRYAHHDQPEHDPEIVVEKSNAPFVVCVKNGRATDRHYPRTAEEAHKMVLFYRGQKRDSYFLVRDRSMPSGWRVPGYNEFSFNEIAAK